MDIELLQYLTVLMNEIAVYAHRSIFWYTPYRTGNLARNGITDVGTMGLAAAGFSFFPTPATNYGRILNEAAVINYRTVNNRTGRVSAGSYPNRHYQWLDNGMARVIEQIPLSFPGIRRVA